MGRMAGTVYIYLVFYADVISQGFVTGYTKPQERLRGRFPVHWPLSYWASQATTEHSLEPVSFAAFRAIALYIHPHLLL